MRWQAGRRAAVPRAMPGRGCSKPEAEPSTAPDVPDRRAVQKGRERHTSLVAVRSDGSSRGADLLRRADSLAAAHRGH